MIVLLSSSPSRASILRQAGFSFKQESFKFDESIIDTKSLSPARYVYEVCLAKQNQAKSLIDSLIAQNHTVILADSCVAAANRILGKASDINEAKSMLMLQSGANASVFSAMLVLSSGFSISSVSEAAFSFFDYDEARLSEYLSSGAWQGKAGAMMIEGFSGEFVRSFRGSMQTAMGLDIDILKAFL